VITQTFKAFLRSFAAGGTATPPECPQEDPAAVTVSVVSDTDFGMVVSGIRCPEGDREELPVGGADDIRVGDEAPIYSSKSGVVSCRVLGFDEIGRYQMLIVRPSRDLHSRRYELNSMLGIGVRSVRVSLVGPPGWAC